MPADGAGTSIVALSDSSVTSGSSTETLVAGRDVDLDHGDVVEVPDVRDATSASLTAAPASGRTSTLDQVHDEARGGAPSITRWS